MKRESRVFKICVCVLTGLLMLAGYRAYAADVQRFSVNVAYGYNGIAKVGEGFPATVEIKNDGDAFEGSINLYISTSMAYASDIAIGAGDTKSVSFYLPEAMNRSKIHIIINDAHGKTVYSQGHPVRVLSHQTSFIGMLSDDYGALSYFSNLIINNQAYSVYPTTVNLSKILYPADYNSLDMFDLIVINDFDTGKLNQSQSELLKSWVERGGTLLVGTGVHYQKTVSGFLGGYLSGTIGSIEPKTGHLGMESESYYDADESDGISLDILNIRVEDGSDSDGRWYQLVQKGLGNIAVFQFDLAGKNLLDWRYRNESMGLIVHDILRNKPDRPPFLTFDFIDMPVDRLISNSYINDIPNIGLYIAILSVYIILIPVIYLVMKKMDKRHFIWITVPALSVLFGVLIYITGSGSRLKNPMLNYFCVLTMNGYNTQETVYIGSTSPRNRPYSFSVNNEYNLFSANRYNYYSTGNDSDYGDAKLVIKKAPAAHDVSVRNNSAFESNYFCAEKYNASIEDVSVQLEYFNDGCHVVVANHADFDIENAGIIMPSYGIIKIDRLNSGETAEFDGNDVIPEYTSDLEYIIIPYDSAEKDIAISRRNQLSTYLNYTDMGIYRWAKPYFTGFANGYAPDLGDNPHMDTAGDTMIFKDVEIVSSGNEVYIPDIRRYVTTSSGYDSIMQNYVTESIPLQATFEFGNIAIDSLTIHNVKDSVMATVSFFNFETGEFDVVFSNGVVLAERSEPYFDGKNNMRAQYEVAPDSKEHQALLPVISASGTPAAGEILNTK